MDRTSLWVSSAALVVGLAAAARSFLATPEPLPTSDDAAAVAAEWMDLERRVSRLESAPERPALASADPHARIAALDARLATLEERQADSGSPAAASASPRSLGALPDGEVLRRARAAGAEQWKTGGEAMDALLAWEEVLRRRPTPADERDAWAAIGFAHRHLKDHAKEEAAFREAVRAWGDDAQQASWMRYQVAWAQTFRGDARAARDTMAEVARAAGASKSVRGHARLYEARLSLELEDPDRARQAVDELLREHSGSTAPDSEWLVERANEYVRKLESRR